MSKLRKKIVVPISLTLTGCLVVAAFVLNDSLTKVDANVAYSQLTWQGQALQYSGGGA